MEKTTKVCFSCNKEKSITEFHRDGKRYKPYCKPCRSAKRKTHSNGRVGREAERRAHLQARYGITLEDYNDLLESQNGLCAVCDKPMERINVDHCHSSGKVRGLLCFGCNVAIGHFNDDIEVILSAVEYIRKHSD